MSTINNSSASSSSSYAGYVSSLQSQISTINSQLNTGKKTLSTADQSTITSLSAKSSSYSAVNTSITNAQSVIKAAQTGLTSIADVLNQMQRIASQATVSGADTSMSMNFQNLLTQVGKYAVAASFNGSNLLAGTAGLFTQTDTNSAAPKTFVASANIYGVVTFGVLSGITVDRSRDATAAVDAIRTALNTVRNNQISLTSSYNNLTSKLNSIATQASSAQSTITSLQSVNKPQLQSQLQALNTKLATYQLLSSMG